MIFRLIKWQYNIQSWREIITPNKCTINICDRESWGNILRINNFKGILGLGNFFSQTFIYMNVLKIKLIYQPVEESDGYRVLVDRLWPRRVKKEAAKLDEWK